MMRVLKMTTKKFENVMSNHHSFIDEDDDDDDDDGCMDG